MAHLTKREAIRNFRGIILPEVVAQYGPHDKPAIREAWNDYTDALCKDDIISQRQYETWTYPN